MSSLFSKDMEPLPSKNQTATPTNAAGFPNDIVVKDYDGKLKVLEGGELRELDEVLSESEVGQNAGTQPQQQATQLAVPKFTDIAVTPEEVHFQEPPKDTSSPEPSARADLHFHPDDKEEIQQELEKLTQVFQIAPQKKYSASKIARKLADKHALTLTGDAFSAFSKIILSYFRQMRSTVDIRASLTGATEDGGFGISAEEADRILSIVRHLKQKIEEADGVVIEEGAEGRETPAQAEPKQPTPKQSAPVKPEASHAGMPSLADAPTGQEAPQPAVPAEKKPQPAQPAAEEKEEKEEQKEQPSAPPPAVNVPKPSYGAQEQPPTEPVKRQTRSRPSIRTINERENEKMPKVVRPTEQKSDTSFIQDVKRPAPRQQKSHLTGPVDELSGMDLQRWRMLDEDPRIRAGKVLGKIQNLEKESYMRKSQGLQAWRGSEVYQHYLHLGQMSLEKGKDVSGIIDELTKSGKETLSLDEFEAVSDLNRTLRF